MDWYCVQCLFTLSLEWFCLWYIGKNESTLLFQQIKIFDSQKFKMPILTSIRENLAIIGLSSHQSTQKYPFNARNLTSLFFQFLNIGCNFGYLMYEAKDLMEITDSMFLTITAILTVSIFINLNWRMKQLFEFIDNLERTVDKSKWNVLKLSRKYSKDFHFSHLFSIRTNRPGVKNHLQKN